MSRGKKILKMDFHYSEKNEPFGNSYSNFDFLIITKNLGGLAAMEYGCISLNGTNKIMSTHVKTIIQLNQLH